MTTLANAATVLHWLKANPRDTGVNAVAAAMGWPKSTTSRLLAEMEEHGLLLRDPLTRAYGIGLLPLELARLHRAGVALFEAADTALAQITRRTRYSTGLVVLDGIHTVVLRSRSGSRPMAVYTPPGQRGPAWSLATGRCLLARLSDEEIARRFSPFPPRPQPGAIGTLTELMERLTTIRDRGWDEAGGEAHAGHGGLAVAVADPRTGDTVALYAAYALPGTPSAERSMLCAGLLDIAAGLGAQFGGSAPGMPAPLQKRICA